tara:strand:- start:1507 stop:1920 length:414 start_codon:yes stop_codon:yes gene_type:complete
MLNTSKIDKSSVPTPKPKVTESAFSQIILMKKHDFTLENKDLRISIKGKECDGFTYEAFFDLKNDEDLFCLISDGSDKAYLLFDPFSAFYLQKVELDYILDPEENIDGFTINNPDQELHKGKFWVQKGASKPPMIKG